MDRSERELARRFAEGDWDAGMRLTAMRLRLSDRDPRKDPRPGDVVVAPVGPSRKTPVGRRILSCVDFSKQAGKYISEKNGTYGPSLLRGLIQACKNRHCHDVHFKKTSGYGHAFGTIQRNSFRTWSRGGVVDELTSEPPPVCVTCERLAYNRRAIERQQGIARERLDVELRAYCLEIQDAYGLEAVEQTTRANRPGYVFLRAVWVDAGQHGSVEVRMSPDQLMRNSSPYTGGAATALAHRLIDALEEAGLGRQASRGDPVPYPLVWKANS